MDRLARWVELIGRIRLVEWNWECPEPVALASALGITRHATQHGAWHYPGCEWVSLPTSVEFPEADIMLQQDDWPTEAAALRGAIAYRETLQRLQVALVETHLGIPNRCRRARLGEVECDYHGWVPSGGGLSQPRTADLLDSTLWSFSKFNIILSRDDYVLPCHQELHLLVLKPVAMSCKGGGEEVR